MVVLKKVRIQQTKGTYQCRLHDIESVITRNVRIEH